MKANLILIFSVLLAACSTTVKQDSQTPLDKIVPGFSGKFCQYDSVPQLGGIAVSKDDGSYQNAIGKCFHAWPRDEMMLIYIGDDTQPVSQDDLAEMLDESIHPQNYYSDAEVAEMDCTDGSQCKKNAELLKRGVVVHFNSGKYEPENTDALSQFARAAGAKHVTVMVVGHTDNTFTEAYNRKISEKRAKRVKELLLYSGLSKSQVSVDWKGDSIPVDSNDTPSGRANNRRSEINVKVKQHD